MSTLVVIPQICYNKVFNIAKPQYNKPIPQSFGTSLNQGSTVIFQGSIL